MKKLWLNMTQSMFTPREKLERRYMVVLLNKTPAPHRPTTKLTGALALRARDRGPVVNGHVAVINAWNRAIHHDFSVRFVNGQVRFVDRPGNPPTPPWLTEAIISWAHEMVEDMRASFPNRSWSFA